MRRGTARDQRYVGIRAGARKIAELDVRTSSLDVQPRMVDRCLVASVDGTCKPCNRFCVMADLNESGCKCCARCGLLVRLVGALDRGG